MRLYFTRFLVALSTALPFAGAPCPAEPVPAPLKARVLDVGGSVHVLGDASDARPAALVFLSTDCPICNRYVPELNRLSVEAGKLNGRVLGVLSDPTLTRAAAAQYVKAHGVTFPILFDASGTLAAALRPAVTPEAFVLDGEGVVRYRGRIDDANADIGRARANVTRHELADALAAVAGGVAVATPAVPSVGCVFEAWDAKALDGAPAHVTYARDIAPIFNANCVTCHRPGEVAPFSLLTHAEAAKHAKQIARVTGERLMPPWKAEENFGHFIGERRLLPREIALLGAWAKAGAPEGDASDLPPVPAFNSGWALGEPDLVLKMPRPITVPASGADVYRAFALPTNLTEDKYVVAFEFRPGAKSVLHHALFFLDNSGAARRLEAASADGKPGYRSFGGPGFLPSGDLGGWAPGAQPGFLAEGVGRPVSKGADVVVQIHYHPDGTEHQDQSTLALYFAKKPVTKVLRTFMLASRQIDIPAGEKQYVINKSMTVPADVSLVGLIPHMHLVGRSMKVTATLADGKTVPLIWVKDWDYQWQDQYRLATPVRLPKGTRVDLEAVYDNSTDNPNNPSSPPKRVVRGEQTTNEMCICFVQFLVENPFAAIGTGGDDAAQRQRRERVRKYVEGMRRDTMQR